MNTEITLEIRLITASGLEAAPGHKEENHRTMYFVARAKVDHGLVPGKLERALGVDLHVDLESWS